MTSFTLYPHSYSIIPSIHHQNIHRIHQNNSYHHHYLIYLVSRSTHLGTRSPLYIILYSTSFISMTSFTLYPHSYSIIPSIHHQNIHRIHLNNSYHHHYLIYLVSRSTHLGTRSPLYIILYSTSFISMTSFPLYPHSYSVIPSIHHQNIHRIHQNNSYHHHYLIYLVSRSTHLGTRSPLYLHTLFNIIHFNDIIRLLYPHSYSVIPFIHHKTFTAFTRITPIITIISFILFQDLHILEQDLHSISYFTQHHHFNDIISLYIHSLTVSFHPFITKTFTAFTWITRIITIISFILFQDLHILEQDSTLFAYFIQHHSFQWHHSLYIHTHTGYHSDHHQQNIHRIHLNNSYHHHYLIYLVSRSTHWNKISTLFLLYSTSFISMTSFHSIPTLIQCPSIHSSPKHSPHSPE